jgi:anti-sigma B factor antagonist
MSDYPAGPDDIRMTIDVTTKPTVDAVVVTAHGEVDLTTSDELRVAVDRLIDDGAGAVVLDLSDVGFVDSTALGVLVSFHRRLDERLFVAAAQPVVLRLLEITQFTSVLRMTDSVATALATLQSEITDPPDAGPG